MVDVSRTDEFYKAKYYIDHLIIFEMKINRISAVSFFNREPEKPAEVSVEEFMSDDSDEEIVEPATALATSMPQEYALRSEILEALKRHYEGLAFVWTQEDDKICISWQ